MKKTKVCIFCESWESGGIESFICNVLSNMDLNGLDIDIVVSQLKRGVFYEKIKVLGVSFVELSGNQRALLKNYKLFYKLLKNREYDVIHMNIFHALSFAYGVIAYKLGVKTRIAHSHNTALRRSHTRFIKLIIHKICRQLLYGSFTDFWACSSAAALFMFPGKVIKNNDYKFFPNGIDIDKFQFDEKKRANFREHLGVDNKTLIVNIGRLCAQKNQSFLLDTAKALEVKGESFEMIFIGSGEMSDELKAKSDKLGVSDKVIFFGTTFDIPSVLSAADVMAFPSLFEGLGIAVIEAQAAGLPVVCSENVPREAMVTELISSVALESGASKWADALIKKAGATKRTNMASEIKNKGYDIKSTAAEVEKVYRGLK